MTKQEVAVTAYTTSHRAGEIAREIGEAERQRWREYQRREQDALGRTGPRDGLDRLLDDGQITPDMHATGKRYQAAYLMRLGSPRGCLSDGGGGDRSAYDGALVDAGALVSAIEAKATTAGPLAILRFVAGEGLALTEALRLSRGHRNSRLHDQAVGWLCEILG